MKSRKSPRKKGFDYTTPGAYFITICTKDRKHYFGEIHGSEMVLNRLGKYTTDHRKQISNHYPTVQCDEFICMPNHIHGIIIICDNQNQSKTGTQFLASGGSGDNKRTYKNTSLNDGIQPKSGSLGSIVRGFKIGITKHAKKHSIPFAWQSRYHDAIIRNQNAYDRIKRYIKNNPKNWKEDRFIVNLIQI